MTVSEIITTSNERTLDVVTSVQKQIVEGAKALVNITNPDSESLELPTAKDLLDQAYGFQTRLMKANHDFAVALVDAFPSASAEPAAARK
jgi:hypothetical protein